MKRLRTVTASALLVATLATVAAAPGDAPVAQTRLTAAEIDALAAQAPPSSQGPRTTALVGDSTKPGLYTVRVALPAHTQVRAHRHRDNRSVTVLSGRWSMGYGEQFDAKALKELPPGSVYTEPAGVAHFSQTGDEPAVILVTGYGPSDTTFASP